MQVVGNFLLGNFSVFINIIINKATVVLFNLIWSNALFHNFIPYFAKLIGKLTLYHR